MGRSPNVAEAMDGRERPRLDLYAIVVAPRAALLQFER